MRKISVTKQRLAEWLIRDKYRGDRAADLSDDLARLRKGEPADYVIGWSDFCGCRIGLESRPLIPRPETEYWTEQAIEAIRRSGLEGPACLDIFAGSGCVGIAVLKHCPGAHLDFIEKDAKHCEQIGKNLESNGIARNRCGIIQSDLFAQLRSSSPKLEYDFIFANPPYVPAERKERLAKSVTDWEPSLALFAGDKGLALIEKFLRQAKGYLRPGGRIWLEFDSGQKRAIGKLLEEEGYADAEFHKDQYGRWRFCSFAK